MHAGSWQESQEPTRLKALAACRAGRGPDATPTIRRGRRGRRAVLSRAVLSRATSSLATSLRCAARRGWQRRRTSATAATSTPRVQAARAATWSPMSTQPLAMT
eukprot:3870602-Pleurochrysis_carterae.AAC.1